MYGAESFTYSYTPSGRLSARTMDLDGRTALVTGSSRNIGRAIAETLAEAGADVGITARSDEEGCAETAARVEAAGGRAAVALGDLADPEDIDGVVDAVRDELGPIDVLVNNASYRPRKPFLEVTLEEWERVHAVDLRAMFLCCQAVIPDMIRDGGGAIVNLLGKNVYVGRAGKTHVVANKAGIPGLTRGLALEFGEDGIRANAVCPSLVDTDRDLENYENWDEYADKAARVTALKRIGEPDEVADAVCFLVSERASYVTGQVLHVNGGSFPAMDLAALR